MRIIDLASKSFVVFPPDLGLIQTQEKIIKEYGEKVIVSDGENILKVFSGL